MKRPIAGSQTADNPAGILVTEKGAMRWARENMPRDLKRAGFVPSVFNGERGWRINYSMNCGGAK